MKQRLSTAQQALMDRVSAEGTVPVSGPQLRTAEALYRRGHVTLRAVGPDGQKVVPYTVRGWHWEVCDPRPAPGEAWV